MTKHQIAFNGYFTKDSGERETFDTGMVRDTSKGKPRFDLIMPVDVPYNEQMLTRLAALMARGAEKYDDRNWEKARTAEELERFKASAFRHFMQWLSGEDDEDHAAAVIFNLMGAELVRYHMRHDDDEEAQEVDLDELMQVVCTHLGIEVPDGN